MNAAMLQQATAVTKPKPPVIRVMRIRWYGAPDPQPGDLIRSKAGKIVYLVHTVTERHKAMLSALPRLTITVRCYEPSDYDQDDLATAFSWAHTAIPPRDGRRHPSAAATALANAAARREADNRAQARARRMRAEEKWAMPGQPDPVRLPAESRKTDSVRPGEVDPATWTDPVEVNEHTKQAKKVRGHRSADVLVRMKRRPNSQITDAHIRAAEKVRAAYDIARLGLGGATGFEPSTGYVPPRPKTGHGAAAEGQYLRCLEVARVIKAVGPRRMPLFDAVIIRNEDLTTHLRKTIGDGTPQPKIEMGKLIGLLDTLADFYHDEMAHDTSMGNVL